MTEPYRIAVLVSGSGSNLQSLIDTVHAPGGPIEIVLVVSSKEGVPALERARRAGIPTAVVALAGRERAERDAELADVVEAARPDLVVLAGWMSIVTGTFIDRFPDRLVNLHPSLLPSFPGLHAIEQALEWGVRLTGVTVHYVEELVDGGPPILQEAVPVMYGDTAETLTERIREVEHRLVPQAVRLFAAGRVRRDPVDRRRVQIVPGGEE
ncbi:MAG: phosphoribosylglycinamide formyltransferase [Thermoleophilia bacterium]